MVKMNILRKKNLLLPIILILSGGMFNSALITVEETEENNNPNFQFLEFFTNIYDLKTYVSGCEKAMHEDARFYNHSEIVSCKDNVSHNFDQAINDFDKPDLKYFTIENTNYRAKYSKDIYEIKVIGTYCDKLNLNDFLSRDTKCTNREISKLFMSKNIDSDDWGFAAKGFETTNGKYLKVIGP
tara:strand:- start:955 stop:1506 length:552 start_codon:yes stop_codon:yes gene_type:complete